MKRSALLFGAGGLLGYLAWGGPEWVALASLLPMLWMAAANRVQAFSAVAAYYLVGSRCLPDSAGAFFEFDGAYIAGLAMWVLAAAANAAPWAVLWTASTNWRALTWRLIAVVAIITIPPLGWIGWLNPWLSASALVPGFGWLSVAAGALVLIGVALISRRRAAVRWSVAVAVALTAILTPQSDLPMPKSWHAIDTDWGAFPKPATKQEFERAKKIVVAADTAFEAGSQVVVLPEQIAGVWSASRERFIRAYLARWLEDGRTLVLGATMRENGEFFNTASIVEGQGTRYFRARQTVPFSMWRPWAAESFNQAWLSAGTVEIGAKKVAVSVCFEDFLFGLGLLSFFHDDPNAIVSIANGWWAANSNEIAVQRLHIRTFARVFNVPLIRAINI